jgi:small subunit ribosomal protein S7
MARRPTPPKPVLPPDPIYQNHLVAMIVNRIMKKGKKSLAYHICYQAISKIQIATKTDAIPILEEAVRNVTPIVVVKGRRVGGSTRQIPLKVEPEQGTALAIRWLLSASRSRSGRDMASKLSNELLDASKNMGNAVRKREDVHRMAEANKAFAKHRF